MKEKSSRAVNKISGLTLIELVMSIIIIAVSFIPISIIYKQVLGKLYVSRVITTAHALAEEKMDEVLGDGYTNITNEGPTAFSSPFGAYTFQVEWHYVNSGALNTSVGPTVTDYKNVTVRVFHDIIGSIGLVSLLTNY